MAKETKKGAGVDAQGGPVVDPTQNVLQLVEAAIQRQDDLRNLDSRRIDAEIKHLNDVDNIRSEHAKELRLLESSRLDSIRQVDVLAVSTAADRAGDAIAQLASTTATNAETLRNTVTNSATTLAAQFAVTVGGIIERTAALERSMYEGIGKVSQSDPALASLVAQVKILIEDRANKDGKSTGLNSAWLVLLGAATLFSIFYTVYTHTATVIPTPVLGH